ncbi:MAG: divalent metal cation transporter [Flavihumibacter sp.]
MTKRPFSGTAFWGAAFMMATSAMGPGFLTQTSYYTDQLGASFGFVILFSIVIDIGVQLNIWRIISGCGLPAQDIANRLLPGLGWLLSLLVFFGGLAFNIGNLAGAALGLQYRGMDTRIAVLFSTALVIWLLTAPNALRRVDRAMIGLGIAKIGLTAYVAIASAPPLAEAALRSIDPETIDWKALITLVGGTVGGYICFAGAHRLLASGKTGPGTEAEVSRSAVTGIFTASSMRVLLFLAALGVVSQGIRLDGNNPAADVFLKAAGNFGYRLFGIVMWMAGISSVIGSSYTSISFVRNMHPLFGRYEKGVLALFILVSAAVFLVAGKPVQLLVLAGTINGFILPFALLVLIIAVYSKKMPNNYRHPVWLGITGLLIALALGWISIRLLVQ